MGIMAIPQKLDGFCENPMKPDDLGLPLFQETSIFVSYVILDGSGRLKPLAGLGVIRTVDDVFLAEGY